ncbi:MAG: trigger factor [Proteobacteria bacterium]|nr:trigger factor [Pseudomonadota bacterium]
MKVDISNVGSFQKKLVFTVDSDSVKKKLDDAYRTLGQKAQIKGFRAGKIPRRVLEMRFGKQVVSDVAADLIQSSYTEALAEHEIEPVGRPDLEDVPELRATDAFEFTICVDVKPTIEVETYEGVEVEYPKVEVADEEVEGMARQQREARTKLVEVEREAVAGDFVLVELKATDGDEVILEEPGTMIRTDADPYFPGLEDVLLGMKAGDSKTETVTFGEDARSEAVAGCTLQVEVSVINVQANEVPELSDELAEELGFEGGADGMMAALRAQLEEGRSEMARNQARANLLQVLIDKNPFDVPSGMIDQNLQMLMEELKMQQAYRGADPRTIQFGEAQIADLRIRAEFAAKAGLILEHVRAKQSIEVVDADLEAKYQELSDGRGQTIEAVRGYFQKEGMVDELKDRLLEEKALDWLLEHSTLVEPVAKKAEEAPVEAAAESEAAEEEPTEEVPAEEAAAEEAPAEEAPDENKE